MTVVHMSLATGSSPAPRLFRLSVEQYHQMIGSGILSSADRLELLEGLLVNKMPQNPRHFTSLQALISLMLGLLPNGWTARSQGPITLSDSEPEPDFCVARGRFADYAARHPGPSDIGLVVEIADSSLGIDRTTKARIYAQAGIGQYWIVNLLDRQVEVLSQPVLLPEVGYAQVQVYAAGSAVPLLLDGVTVGQIAVAEVLT